MEYKESDESKDLNQNNSGSFNELASPFMALSYRSQNVEKQERIEHEI